MVTDLDAGIEAGEGVKTAEVFAQFQRNVEPFKQLIREAIARVAPERTCTHCLPHTGLTLPVELP